MPLILHLNAGVAGGRHGSGKSRRCYVAVDDDGTVLWAVDAYTGDHGSMPKAWRCIPRVDVRTTPAHYRETLRTHPSPSDGDAPPIRHELPRDIDQPLGYEKSSFGDELRQVLLAKARDVLHDAAAHNDPGSAKLQEKAEHSSDRARAFRDAFARRWCPRGEE